jgi:hypothetical protein
MGDVGSVTISCPVSSRRTAFPTCGSDDPEDAALRAAAAPERADKRSGEIARRLDEAADVLAETLLDMWRKEQRSRRAAAHGGTS